MASEQPAASAKPSFIDQVKGKVTEVKEKLTHSGHEQQDGAKASTGEVGLVEKAKDKLPGSEPAAAAPAETPIVPPPVEEKKGEEAKPE